MKRQSANIDAAKTKQPSPTKRKWNGKVSDVLSRIQERVLPEDINESTTASLLSFELVESMLHLSDSLVTADELDTVIEEAEALNIPQHNDNLKKI